MIRLKPNLIVAIALMLHALAGFASEDVGEILKKADAYRLEGETARVDVEVEVYVKGLLDVKRVYRSYFRPERRSLVLMKSKEELGQKLLMVGAGYWLVSPEFDRPMIISSWQPLLGDVNTGDIARMTWSEDYNGRVIGDVDVDGRACLQLLLSSARAGVTYRRVDLFLDKTTYIPVKAGLYIKKNRQDKEARYEAKEIDGQMRIVAMTVRTLENEDRHTIVRYLETAAVELPDGFFHPMALKGNELLDY